MQGGRTMKIKKRLGIPLCRQCNCYHTLSCENVFADSPADVFSKKFWNVVNQILFLNMMLIILHFVSYPITGVLVWLFWPDDGAFPGNTKAALIFVTGHVLTALMIYCIMQRKKWFPAYFGKVHFQ
jgi:hypothetical protein